MKYLLTSIFIFGLGLTGILNPFKNFIVTLISPIQFGLAKSAYVTKDAFSFFVHVNQVRDKNLDLLEQVHTLQNQISELKFVADENILLRDQLKIKEGQAHTDEILLADVLVNPYDISKDTYLINLGSRDGIRKGDMAVVGINLVGTIETVEYSRSVVRMITSPQLTFTVYDIDNSQHPQALAKGKHSTYITLERLVASDKVKVGDMIVTSGKDGIFKPNFVVGTISQIFEDPSQPLKSAEVKTTIDFTRINKLFVMKVAD